MLDIIKQINAKATAIRYIESCEGIDHFNVMDNYIEIYRNKFEDFLGYTELRSLIEEKKRELYKI
jgi:hypothetical protein